MAIWSQNMFKYFVLGHYLFLDTQSFSQATILENCSLLRTDYVRGQNNNLS